MIILLLLISLNISPIVNKANKLYEKEKYEEAYELYKRASILDPENKKIKFNLADCAYKLKRFRESADGFVRLSGAKDKTLKEKSFYNLGNTFMGVKQYEEAISAYKKALLLNPNDTRAKRNLEIAKLMSKNQKKENKEEKKNKKEKEKQEQKLQPQSRNINEALKNEQKETMKKALKKRGGRRKEAGKW
ncbi:MAG: tetratricopeptide repeat protein [candidate division WOR-3 bacterium]|nr:tetratricopeptide repeat protein [candidate division WOR-3 bacterium]